MAVNYACCGLARVSSSSSDYDCPNSSINVVQSSVLIVQIYTLVLLVGKSLVRTICINNYMEEQFGRL